jgi:hypothetical protein
MLVSEGAKIVGFAGDFALGAKVDLSPRRLLLGED